MAVWIDLGGGGPGTRILPILLSIPIHCLSSHLSCICDASSHLHVSSSCKSDNYGFLVNTVPPTLIKREVRKKWLTMERKRPRIIYSKLF
ncbi:hypothetical protein J5N97_028671 [Dioscorea zingiberensis]|uniref:Uncharacterized protein n=1 Tax=Dioscorea zingiberensis TaxID=325984 RepID=A0A9D5BZX0_9LILI|nr:hypothetical protein J5N97_028671 [Dioscorea zingiberensis]